MTHFAWTNINIGPHIPEISKLGLKKGNLNKIDENEKFQIHNIQRIIIFLT